jgi:hypothetical protein
MHHHLPRVAGLIAILAALLLAPSALAAGPQKSSGAGAKELAYGKHCGPKAKGHARSGARAKCLDAMSKLDAGTTASPSKACRSLSRKRGKGERKSAFARCVVAGARLLTTKEHGDGADEGDDDESGDAPGLDGATPAGQPASGDDDDDVENETDDDPFGDASAADDDLT